MNKCEYGWLVVNHFINTGKFSEIYAWLRTAAENKGIRLDIKTNAELLIDLCTAEAHISGRLPDFVLFWDKDVRLGALLERLGLRLFNSARAVALCDDKSLTYLALSAHGIPQPRTVIAPLTFPSVGYGDMRFLREAGSALGYPMVIKENNGSFGAQVQLAHSFDEAAEMVSRINTSSFIMQELVASSYGRDIRVNVVGGQVAACMLRRSVNGDFRSNLTLGGVSEAYDISPAQAAAALRAVEALGLDFAGVDVLFGENDSPLICEVNSNAHFKTTFDCTGVNMAELIIDYIHKEITG